jgi:hypothetical protein
MCLTVLQRKKARCQAAMASSDEQQQPLHILFFPYIAHGH